MSPHVLSSHIDKSKHLVPGEAYLNATREILAPATTCHWSMHQVGTFRWTLREDLAHYRKAGIPAIGLWMKKIRDEGEESAIDLVAESGLSVSSLGWLGGFTGTEGLSHVDAVDEAIDAVQLAGQLSARNVVVVSGAIGYHINSHAQRCTRSALRALGDVAAAIGVTVNLLPHCRPLSRPWSIFRDWRSALDHVASCGHPRVKLALDVEQLQPSTLSPAQLQEIVPYLGSLQITRPSATVNGLETSCTVSGNRPSLAMNHAEADNELSRDLAALLQAGYRGFCEFEPWSESVWRSRYDEWLSQLMPSHARTIAPIHR